MHRVASQKLNVEFKLAHVLFKAQFVLSAQWGAILRCFDPLGHAGGKHHAGRLSAFFAIGPGQQF